MKKQNTFIVPVSFSVIACLCCLLTVMLTFKHLAAVAAMPPDTILKIHPETYIIISRLHQFIN